MKSTLLSIYLTLLLGGFSAYLTAYSRGESPVLILGVLFVAALLGTIAASVWFRGIWYDRMLKAGKIVFPMTTTIYLLGYFFQNLITM